jgi:hypothetical protein
MGIEKGTVITLLVCAYLTATIQGVPRITVHSNSQLAIGASFSTGTRFGKTAVFLNDLIVSFGRTE